MRTTTFRGVVKDLKLIKKKHIGNRFNILSTHNDTNKPCKKEKINTDQHLKKLYPNNTKELITEPIQSFIRTYIMGRIAR